MTTENPDSLYQILYSRIEDLEKESRELKAELIQQKIDKANTIINWSATMFAVLAILYVIAGGLGMKEFSRIRQTEDLMKEKLYEVKQVLMTIEGHKAVIENEMGKIRQYQNEIVKELKNFKSQKDQELENFQYQKDKILEDTKEYIQLSFFLNSGREAYHSGEYLKSIELLSKALDLDPQNIQVLSFKAASLMRAGRREEALALYKEILSIDEKAPDGYIGISSYYFDSDKPRSLEYCEKALEVDPKSVEALNLKGHICRKLDRFDEAIEAHLEASRIKELFESYFFIAFNYYAKADLENAHKFFHKAHYHAQESIEQSYRNHWAHFVVGVIEGIEGKTDRAKDSFETSLGLNNTQKVRTMMKNDLLFLKKFVVEKSVLEEIDLMISYLGDDV